MYYANDSDDWLSVDECAARLNTSTARVMELVEQRVLKSRQDGGYLLVQPALIAGITTEVR